MDSALPSLTAATAADVPAIATLMNFAFRGGGSDASWTTESDHFQGNRTSEALLREDIAANADAAMSGARPMAYSSVASGSSRRPVTSGT